MLAGSATPADASSWHVMIDAANLLTQKPFQDSVRKDCCKDVAKETATNTPGQSATPLNRVIGWYLSGLGKRGRTHDTGACFSEEEELS